MKKKTFLDTKGSSGILSDAVEQFKNSQEYAVKHMKILPELEALIPALTGDEFAQLKANILAEGCREPLILWEKSETEFILVDGHNRYRICQEAGKEFRIDKKNFDSLEVIKDWMINNQLGKRNVTEQVKSYLRGLQYDREKNNIGGTGANQYKEGNGDNLPPQRTREKLAEQHKVSEKTIQRDFKYAIGLELLVGNDYELKSKILNKEIKVNKALIESISEKTPNEVAEIRENIQKGEPQKTLNLTLSAQNHKKILKDLDTAIQNKDKETAQTHLEKLVEVVKNL